MQTNSPQTISLTCFLAAAALGEEDSTPVHQLQDTSNNRTIWCSIWRTRYPCPYIWRWTTSTATTTTTSRRRPAPTKLIIIIPTPSRSDSSCDNNLTNTVYFLTNTSTIIRIRCKTTPCSPTNNTSTFNPLFRRSSTSIVLEHLQITAVGPESRTCIYTRSTRSMSGRV